MKHWVWIFVLGFTLGVSACGKKEEQKSTPEQPAPTSPAEPTTSPAPSQ